MNQVLNPLLNGRKDKSDCSMLNNGKERRERLRKILAKHMKLTVVTKE